MNFSTAQSIENVVWQMRLSDFPRATNRALINSLANGAPPYSDAEQVQNRITTNVNYLELANITHSARRQFTNAFLNVEPPFTVTCDYGPVWKRQEWSSRITNKIARTLKGSLKWFEVRRSVFAADVLHGISPTNWSNPHSWCPDIVGVEDVLVPADTLLTLDNLPFFCVYRQYTAMQLWKMINKKPVDPGWNIPLAKRCIKWADDEARRLAGSSWPSFWSPEKMEERIKSDGALYSSDAVPTIDCYDVYFWCDEEKKEGWRRRIVLDAWGSANPIGAVGGTLPDKTRQGTRGEFLYTSGDRLYARKLSQIVHWQFADGSCVAPFKYHSVRSLGYLLYAVCHLQNRLRCKFNDATFEAMLQYFRVANPADAEKLTQVNLIDKGVIPEGLEFVKAGDRWQVPEGLAQAAMTLNRQTMADNSVSFTQDWDFGREEIAKETATRTRAKNTATAALVGAMLSQAYKYEDFRYLEICRRFCRPESKDPEVREFRLCMLQEGVPEEALDAERWDVTSTRILGSGDKQQQVEIAEALMRVRPLLDPNSQKHVDRIYISAYTEDYALTKALVPEVKGISKSQELATLACGTLMQGMEVQIQEGIDHTEYIEAMLTNFQTKLAGIMQRGAMATPEEIVGLNTMAAHIVQHIQKVAEIPQEKARVKAYGDALGKMMNEVKGLEQRLAEQMQQAQAGGQGADPKDAAKAQAMVIQAQTKAQLTSESHAQRTAQRQLQFEQKMQQDEERHQMEMQKAIQEQGAALAEMTAQHQAELDKIKAQLLHDVSARELELNAKIAESAKVADAQVEITKKKAVKVKPKKEKRE